MTMKILEKHSFSRKIFFIILAVSVLPLLICGIFVVKISLLVNLVDQKTLLLFFSLLFLLTIVLTALGSITISKRIDEPIKQFTRSATEIARGNFNHRVPVEGDDEWGRLAKIINFMTTELRRLNNMNLNQIINEKNKTKTILKNIADGVIVTGPDNKVLVVNSVAQSWLGLSEEEILDQPVEKVIYEQNLLALVNKIRAGENSNDSKVELTIKPYNKKKQIVVQAKAARVIDADNNLIGIVTIFRDITKEKEIDRMKTELVSMVAHELRSPLTSIAGFSELLLDEGLTPEQSKEYAEIILKESNRLGDLINKFLDISRIESGKSQMHKTPVQMGHVIESVLEMNMYLAERKGMKVTLNIPEDLDTVWVDREMMGEVILNLFSNAVKYSPEGRPIIIEVQDKEDEQLVRVIDRGYGIPEKSLNRIFDKFYRVTDDEHVQEITGSGLGLSLVKEIIELHEGSIWVESKLGEGSIFTFSIPKKGNEMVTQEETMTAEQNEAV
ncbi:MAG: cell wall metabolism sensor histidine kinase WalK [candidate division KSB1 bacterium]|nr:cell wall metabolism sensor histidine kinase WalK [candidate division KSB1 bacterium]MDZ7336591.1 cell wall metabolism sensor histidine kinase WalK [candidate division KSB1 bacterium]MDZ7358882.1 cell wall metabolism sensor histidine kinase WalK [candidate division KSB1 bacterium]MDZ7401342.1 cell wall metabolism sensor histidine kinase WalK [candidate division KSB1 bacterium]